MQFQTQELQYCQAAEKINGQTIFHLRFCKTGGQNVPQERLQICWINPSRSPNRRWTRQEVTRRSSNGRFRGEKCFNFTVARKAQRNLGPCRLDELRAQVHVVTQVINADLQRL
jgi:hypothetical protein